MLPKKHIKPNISYTFHCPAALKRAAGGPFSMTGKSESPLVCERSGETVAHGLSMVHLMKRRHTLVFNIEGDGELAASRFLIFICSLFSMLKLCEM